MKKFSRMWAMVVLQAVVSAVMLPARPNGPLIVLESGTILNSPSLCSANPMCHVGPLAGGSVAFSGSPQSYSPGVTYSMALDMKGIQFLTRVYGFQLIAFFSASHEPAGSFTPQSAGTQVVALPGEIPVLTHSDPLASGHVTFQWTAPQSAAGEVTFRVASNSADGNFSPTNDLINTAEIEIPAAQGVPPGNAVFYFPQIGAGEFADVVFSTDLIFLNTGAEAPLLAEFFDSQGEPLSLVLTVDGEPPEESSRLELVLAAGQTVAATLQLAESLRSGYARVTASLEVGGTAIFSQRHLPGGELQYQAGVGATGLLQDFSFPVQFESARSDTGVALVRPAEEAPQGVSGKLKLRLYDGGATELASLELELSPGAHLARFVSELFPEFFQEEGLFFRGSLTVEAPFEVAPLTLLQTSAPTLTAFPVITGRADRQP